MSGFLQVTLHPTRKAVQDERTADNGNPEHTGRKIFAFHFEHDTFIQTEMGDLLMNNIHMKQLEQTLTSMEVSEMVGKEHGKLLKDIRAIYIANRPSQYWLGQREQNCVG